MSDLTKEARELGCRDPLMIELADRIDALESGLKAISESTGLHQVQIIARTLLRGEK